MKPKLLIICAITLITSAGAGVYADSIRANKIETDVLNQVLNGERDDVSVEFREGDLIPLTFEAEGDLFESISEEPTYLKIKRTFFMKYDSQRKEVLLSLDDKNYKPIKEMLTGSLTVGATADDPDSSHPSIQVLLRAFLRED